MIQNPVLENEKGNTVGNILTGTMHIERRRSNNWEIYDQHNRSCKVEASGALG